MISVFTYITAPSRIIFSICFCSQGLTKNSGLQIFTFRYKHFRHLKQNYFHKDLQNMMFKSTPKFKKKNFFLFAHRVILDIKQNGTDTFIREVYSSNLSNQLGILNEVSVVSLSSFGIVCRNFSHILSEFSEPFYNSHSKICSKLGN
jgi:hypothetical protein